MFRVLRNSSGILDIRNNRVTLCPLKNARLIFRKEQRCHFSGQ